MRRDAKLMLSFLGLMAVIALSVIVANIQESRSSRSSETPSSVMERVPTPSSSPSSAPTVIGSSLGPSSPVSVSPTSSPVPTTTTQSPSPRRFGVAKPAFSPILAGRDRPVTPVAASPTPTPIPTRQWEFVFVRLRPELPMEEVCATFDSAAGKSESCIFVEQGKPDVEFNLKGPMLLRGRLELRGSSGWSDVYAYDQKIIRVE